MQTENSWTLGDHHPLVDSSRTTGNGYYLVARSYPGGQAECVAIKCNADDSLKRGGGAKRKNKEKTECDPEVLSRSQRRARTQIRRKCLSLQADRMLTLTFRENLTDIDAALKVFKYFSKLMRWRYGDRYKYVGVPEYQKRGAVHFHLALSGYFDVVVVRELWRRAIGGEGNVDMTSPRRNNKNSWNPKRVANYLAKYVGKNDSVDFNRKRYFSGGKIEIPAPAFGWVALGLPIISVLVKVITGLSRHTPGKAWESNHHDGLYYLATI